MLAEPAPQSAMAVRIRQFTDDDWPKFAAFASAQFGPSHCPEAHFNRHWFRTDRHDGWSAQIIESADGELLGMMMVIVVPAQFGDEIIDLGWISSGAVVESVRDKGLGAGLYLWTYRTFPVVGAMSGNEWSLPINSAMGIEIPGVKMRRFIVIHDAATADLCLPQNRSRIASFEFEPPARLTTGLTCRWSDTVPSDVSALWEVFRSTVFCTTARTPDYLQWRYVDAPFLNYRFFETRNDSGLQALAVVRFQETPAGRVCRVVDFMANPTHASLAWVTVAAAAKEEGALFSDFMVIGSCQDQPLLSAGFLPADATTGLNAVPHLLSPVEHREWTSTFHLGGRLARSIKSWRSADAVYFTKADSDRDWPTSYDIDLQRYQAAP